MKKYKFTIHGNTYDTHIKKIEDDYAYMEVNGTEYKVKIETEIQKPKTPKLVRSRVDFDPQEAKIQQKKSETEFLKAPLPGLILKVIVKQGDTVKIGDTILIMEAMKMENNIQAEKDGLVKSIKVSEGQNVMQDEILAEIG